MNAARVKKLASEQKVEFTKKMFRRFCRRNVVLKDVCTSLATGTVVDEDVFSSPDFTFKMSHKTDNSPVDYVCVQTTDGRTVRVVGAMNKNRRKKGK